MRRLSVKRKSATKTAEKMLEEVKANVEGNIVDSRDLLDPENISYYLKIGSVVGVFIPRSQGLDEDVMWTYHPNDIEYLRSLGWRGKVRCVWDEELGMNLTIQLVYDADQQADHIELAS